MIATWVRERMKDCFIPMPCLFVGLSVCLSVCLSVYPFVICLSICLLVFVHLSSVCLSVCLVICHLSVYPFVICLSICLACPLVSLCLSVCFLWVHVCKVTLGELYLYCTGWGCGRLTAWPCSSLRWPGDFLAYNQIKKSLASQGKSNVLTTIHQGAKHIWFELAVMDVWKWEISWPASVSLRTFKTLILI